MKFKITKILLYSISIEWTIWLLIESVNTKCFGFLDSYITLSLLILSMIFNDLID